jgi:cell division protein FtsW (lipid II flippase)
MTQTVPGRTKPSFHLLLLAIVFIAAGLGYVAVIWSGQLRGYSPSVAVAARNLFLFVPMGAAFLWLIRKQKYRGECTLFTVAVILFFFGSVMQYRLFSDPEYGARGADRARARQLKAQTVKLQNINTSYDNERKAFMFGRADLVPEKPSVEIPSRERGLDDLIVSVNTYIPLLALLAFAIAFIVFRNNRAIAWLQRHSLVIGLATLAPFALIVFVFSAEGKFLGQTTPWEPVKILFLVSFAGALTESYRRLGRTRWGLPPFRYIVPFAVIGAMPFVPFFALSDFGQMVVFLGVYFILYAIAVRKRAQIGYAIAIAVLLFGALYLVSSVTKGSGIPPRIYMRFHMWTNTWEPPASDTWWWARDYENYLRSQKMTVAPEDTDEVRQRNSEAWSDRVLQLSQGMVGVHKGGASGAGYGLGYPETVPISDSDFIYAAISEETGLLGALGVLGAVGVFVLAGASITLGAQDMFSKLLAAGFTAFVGLQALVNIGGVLRVLPMTGITLPFVSHGGWSLITSFGMLGVLLALSHRNSMSSVRTGNKFSDVAILQ